MFFLKILKTGSNTKALADWVSGESVLPGLEMAILFAVFLDCEQTKSNCLAFFIKDLIPLWGLMTASKPNYLQTQPLKNHHVGT